MVGSPLEKTREEEATSTVRFDRQLLRSAVSSRRMVASKGSALRRFGAPWRRKSSGGRAARRGCTGQRRREAQGSTDWRAGGRRRRSRPEARRRHGVDVALVGVAVVGLRKPRAARSVARREIAPRQRESLIDAACRDSGMRPGPRCSGPPRPGNRRATKAGKRRGEPSRKARRKRGATSAAAAKQAPAPASS